LIKAPSVIIVPPERLLKKHLARDLSAINSRDIPKSRNDFALTWQAKKKNIMVARKTATKPIFEVGGVNNNVT
jgi:hypothetical protein